MTRTPLILAAALTLSLLAGAASAAPNNNAFKNSAEGNKKELPTVCAQLKKDLAQYESYADAQAGKEEAEHWSDLADAVWDAAVKAKCSWTK